MQWLWEPNLYHKAESGYGDDFMVESRIDVFQEVKAMLEHEVDTNVIAIIGSGQGTEAKIVKRILSWSLAGFTWKSRPKHQSRVQLQRQRQ